MGIFSKEQNILCYRHDAEKLRIEPWGRNSLRVRSTKMPQLPEEDFALIAQDNGEAEITITKTSATIKNGRAVIKISEVGKMEFYNCDGKMLFEEYLRIKKDVKAEYCSSLEIEAREFKPILNGDYHLTARFISSPEEKIYGMGQYQQPNLNLKGSDLELAQRNSQATVPFMVSSLGYGLLWNNPAIGRVVFGKNLTTWEAYSTKVLDYWYTVGDSPAEIEEAYSSVTGRVPMMPEFAMGFWQCKLRYQTQEELLGIAREYKKRNIPISVIVIDYFHWPTQGDWKFDLTYWPDPDAMIAELKEMGIELMVSIWPTVDYRSENFAEMEELGYLIRTDRGLRIAMTYEGNTIHYDATNPEARNYVWDKAKQNYYDKGIKLFWLDEAEPEYYVYDFENYRYHMGPNTQIGNIYPAMYAKTFFDGMKANGQENILNLLRCAWAGSQRYGALVWSGDIHSSFASLRNQVAAGLNMGLAGIPWWTTDIGGFHGGFPDQEDFRELLVRWFEYGTFCPVMRLHGRREPAQPQLGTTGGCGCLSGADNEIWSFGETSYEICKKYIAIRESLKDYIKGLMEAAHEKGAPVIRPLFYDFKEDDRCWEIENQYMFGPDILVAPILYAGQTEREVYLPKGAVWKNAWSSEKINGGTAITVAAPLDQIPLFLKDGFELSLV
jgi:alpha-D-xyloside xylohydrolase